MLPPRLHLPVEILPQPDESTCGPTCLHAVYRYWGRQEHLQDVIARTGKLERGGTIAVFLACDALRQGFQATIYTFNLTVFDPTWFVGTVDIGERLLRQRAEKSHYPRVQEVTAGYIEYLRRRITACQHQVPHFTNDGETLWIFDYIIFSSCFYLRIQIAGWGENRCVSLLKFAINATSDAFFEIEDKLIR